MRKSIFKSERHIIRAAALASALALTAGQIFFGGGTRRRFMLMTQM
jgi:hypothetical protein